MPNSLQSSAIASPASRRATNCSLSSITEHSLQGISPPYSGKEVLPMCPVQCVTYVSDRSQLVSQSPGVDRLRLVHILVHTCPKNRLCDGVQSRALRCHADVRVVLQHLATEVPRDRHEGLLAGLVPLSEFGN